MIVVCDTSPLHYLVLVDLQHILPELFERILIPDAVREELQSAGAPEPIARFLAAEPEWLETRRVSEIDRTLTHLDPSEREAIALAASSAAGLLLIDERKGRHAARERGLAVSGTLGVLDLARASGARELVGRLAAFGTNDLSCIAQIDPSNQGQIV